MGKVIVVTSGKGGTGKTTAVSAIASCLAALGHETLCIDMDISLRNLDLVLGLADVSAADLGDVVSGRCLLEDAVIAHPQIPGLYLLAAPAGDSSELITSADISSVLQDAKSRYEYCLIDSPAGLDTGFYLASAHAELAIVLATSDSTSLRDAQKTVMELDALGIEDIRLVINRLRKKVLKRSISNVDDIIDFVGAPLLGIVPEDEDILIAAAVSKALVLYSGKHGAKAFLRITKRICGERVPLKL